VYKSKRSKATDISKKVKDAVYERDGGCCIICGKRGLPNAHFTSRTRGGLGVERNIVTLCPECHYKYDFGNASERESCKYIIKEYLVSCYPDFNENDLIYKTGF
jgi:5-methylcytosine-specific restriction endonuclease McrA